MPEIHTIYSYLALFMSIVCFSVAISLSILSSNRLVDVSFTVREWLLALVFLMQFAASSGSPDVSVDLFHDYAHRARVIFMVVLSIASVISAAALMYNFTWRIRNTNNVLFKEDKDE